MLPVDALKSMKVFFATPCYGMAVTSTFCVSVYSLAAELQRLGVNNCLAMHSESLITRARNKITAQFLSDDSWTHLVWLDADLMFTPQAVLRLLLCDKDIAAGVYPLKVYDWPEAGLAKGMTYQQFQENHMVYPIRPLDGFVNADGFMRVKEATTGFMAIKRGVFDAMRVAYPNLRYNPNIDDPPLDPTFFWRFFDCGVEPESGKYLSEDFMFSRLWTELGGEIWVDFESKLGHVGQYMYRGDLKASLMAQGLVKATGKAA